MCRHWDALVLNDYKAVMPLPWNKKWGIYYLYSPYYVVAGGVFGKDITGEMLLQFINAIPKKFRYWDMDLNEHNFFPEALQCAQICFKTRTNIYLHLNAGYETLYSNYSKLAKRKLKKANNHQLKINCNTPVEEIIGLYRRHYEDRLTMLAKIDFNNIIHFFSCALSHHVKTYTALFQSGEVAAFYLALYDERYVYWLIGGSTPAGKEAGAFYFLKDAVIKDFAGTNRILRFEGSDVPGITFFNLQFGSYAVQLPRLQVNRLPWPFKYLKQ